MVSPAQKKGTGFKTAGAMKPVKTVSGAVTRRLAFRVSPGVGFRLEPGLQCRFHFGSRVLTAHAVDRFAIPIQRDKVARIHFLMEAFGNKLKKPALRARGSVLGIQTIGTGGRVRNMETGLHGRVPP